MNEDFAIQVNNISKSFRVYFDKGVTIKDRVLFRSRRKYEERLVLKHLSFFATKGEAIGLIGENGCGKSTTLKLLTKIMYPDEGSIEMKGRVSSLIELGAGFHPDMSGRENIGINAAIFGLTRKEITSRVDEIIRFSELEDFIDNPVRTYSSGMYMRLAFAVAINVDADILLIDEILAVGDAAFQAKCYQKLREIKDRGTTIVIVSHALGQIEQICDRTIWLKDGTIFMEGIPRQIHPAYMDYMSNKLGKRKEEEIELSRKIEEKKSNEDEQPVRVKQTKTDETKRWGNRKSLIEKVLLLDTNGKETSVLRAGENACIRVIYSVHDEVKNAVFGVGFFRSDGLQCYGTNTRIDNIQKFDLKRNGSFSFYMKEMPFLPGKYLLDVAIECDEGIPIDYYREALSFEVVSACGDVGVARISHQWKGSELNE